MKDTNAARQHAPKLGETRQCIKGVARCASREPNQQAISKLKALLRWMAWENTEFIPTADPTRASAS